MSIIYELDGEAGTNSDCAPGVARNKEALDTRSDTSGLAADVTKNVTDEDNQSWTTLLNNPNVVDWPSGEYIARLQIAAFETGEVSVKYELRLINALCTLQQTLGTSISISTTGDHVFNTGTINPTAGAIGDRFQLMILGTNTAEHQDRSYTVNVVSGGGPGEIEGPWTVGAPPPVEEILGRRRTHHRFLPAA